ncbi:MAG: DNRLRE domain-containing protein [Anaerolineae bacterium]
MPRSAFRPTARLPHRPFAAAAVALAAALAAGAGAATTAAAPRPAAAAVVATSVTLFPVADAYVDQASPATNHNTATAWPVERDANGRERYPLLRFDTSAIPADATITAADLKVYLNSGTGDSPIHIIVERITLDWDRATVTWNNRPPTSGTWGSWDTDKDPGERTFDIRVLVGNWVRDSMPNHGLTLRGPATGTYERLFRRPARRGRTSTSCTPPRRRRRPRRRRPRRRPRPPRRRRGRRRRRLRTRRPPRGRPAPHRPRRPAPRRRRRLRPRRHPPRRSRPPHPVGHADGARHAGTWVHALHHPQRLADARGEHADRRGGHGHADGDAHARADGDRHRLRAVADGSSDGIGDDRARDDDSDAVVAADVDRPQRDAHLTDGADHRPCLPAAVPARRRHRRAARAP